VNAPCIDPQARLCLLRHLHALKHGLDGKSCHDCQPAAETVAALRVPREQAATPESGPDASVPPPTEPSPGQVQHTPPPPTRSTPSVPLDLATLREVLSQPLLKQNKTGQRAIYLDRLHDGYNKAALREHRIPGKRKFRESLECIVALHVNGAWLNLDRGAWEFCFGGENGGQE